MQLKAWAKHLVHLFDDFDKQIADWGIRPGFSKTRNKISTTDLAMLLLSRQTLSNFLRLYGLQHTTLLCPSLALGVCSNSCLLSQWYYLIISFSAALFSFCLHSFTASGFFFFPMSQLFGSGGLSVGASASALILPMNIQCWFPLGLTVLIPFLSKGLKSLLATPQFESISSLVLSLLYGSSLAPIHDCWKNHSFDCVDLCRQSDFSAF